MQFRDLKKQYHVLKEDIDKGISEVLESSAFILGKPVSELEQKLAEFAGVKHCVSCANGTDALQLMLMVWGVGPGDAIFTSDFTYFASAGTSSILGATPIFVDIDINTFNMSPENLELQIQKVIKENKLTPKVIIPVDLFGQPADYDKIIPIAEKYGLKVLCDAAQGFGGSIRGKMVGSMGNATTTSFFPAKPLGCYGDGGAIFTNSDEEDEILRSLRCQGRSPSDKYDNRSIGMNSRLDTLQAAILIPKLKAFGDYEIDAVNKAASTYTELLKDMVVTPAVKEGFVSSWAQYTIRLESTEQRDALKKHMTEKGIPTMVYYPRGLHSQTAYAERCIPDEDYPNTVLAANTVLSLPMHPYITEEEIKTVCGAIAEFLK